jgi:predicted metal-binding membrane protein
MAATDGSSRLPGLCGAFSQAAVSSLARTVPQVVSPSALIAAWVMMLVAMMPPLLIDPVGHICHSSFAARRPRALTGFVAGYGLVWIAAGLFLLPLAIALRVLVPEPQAGLAAWAVAFAWSCTPAAQIARNLCHSLRRVSAFGMAADRDCFAQGLFIGMPCVAACWPWMIVPMITGSAHLIIMAIVTALLFFERIAPPQPPAWQMPPSLVILHGLLSRKAV